MNMVEIKTPWALSNHDVLREAGATSDGLAADEAQRRLTEYGENTLTGKEQVPWYVLFVQQFANPLVYMLIGAGLIKAYFKGPVDAAVIGAVLLFMAIIGFAQEMKARKAMTALLSLSAPKAKVRRAGKINLLDAARRPHWGGRPDH